MAVLNITFGGRSADFTLDGHDALSDDDIRRVAVELLRSNGVRGVRFPDLDGRTFDDYVVDRLGGGHAQKRIYLRPKVPFGNDVRASAMGDN